MHCYLPDWSYTDDTLIPFVLNIAAWSAKYETYFFERCDHSDPVIIYKMYNDDCCFTLKLNHLTRFCTIDFDVVDESFDYDGFKKIIDFFFEVD